MQKYTAFMCLILSLLSFKAKAQNTNVIQDPSLNYYQYLKSPDYYTVDANDLPTNDIVSYFTADISGNGKKSIFITDSGKDAGARHGYVWTIYYAKKSSEYIKLEVELGLAGPDYIGYIKEINNYGFISSGSSVSAYYLSNNSLIKTNISSDPESFMVKNPQYYTISTNSIPGYEPIILFHNNHIVLYTLAQLAQMYGNKP